MKHGASVCVSTAGTGEVAAELVWIERLRLTAVRELNAHINDRGRCAMCRSDWPCQRALLAEHNLVLCGTPPTADAVQGTGWPVPAPTVLQEDVSVRPLVFGYIRLRHGAPDHEFDRLRCNLAACAEREGFALAEVFTDQYAVVELPAFATLVERLRSTEAQGVVVPSLTHFSRFGGMRTAMRDLIVHETGARVLVADNGKPKAPPEGETSYDG